MTAADVSVVTPVVVNAKVPVVTPSATVTLTGGFTANVEDDSLTTTGPLFRPGEALRVTVPFAPVPPVTLAGSMVRLVTANGFEVKTTV